MIEILLTIYVSVNVIVGIWQLVLMIKREKDQSFMKHLKESINNRDASITKTKAKSDTHCGLLLNWTPLKPQKKVSRDEIVEAFKRLSKDYGVPVLDIVQRIESVGLE